MLNTHRGREMALNHPITTKLLDAIENNNLKSKIKIDNNIFLHNQESLETELAPTLRQIAITHLETAETPAAKSFRGEHLSINSIDYKQYLAKQAQAGSWGTDIEALALGEALRINVVITSIYKDRSDATWCLHLEAEDAPTMHLYNFKNLHWSSNISTLTKSDVNCLFNAIAKELKELEAPAYQTPLNSQSIFKYGSAAKEIIKKQSLIHKALANALQNQQSPAEKEIAYRKEEERIRQLPTEEKNQIAKDYTYALHLARADMENMQVQDKLNSTNQALEK